MDLLPPFNSKVYSDHCTLLHKSQVDGAKAREVKRTFKFHRRMRFYIDIIVIGWKDKSMAFKCIPAWLPCINKTPHITVYTFGGGTPVDSNSIEKWIKIKPVIIETNLDPR